MRKARTVEVKNVKISDGFWDKYRKLVREEILDYQWDALNDRVEGAAKSHCIENFRMRPERKKGILRRCFSGFGCREVAGGRGVFSGRTSG